MDEIRTKEVVNTTSKKEFDLSKHIQLISSEDTLYHKGVNECELDESLHVPIDYELQRISH